MTGASASSSANPGLQHRRAGRRRRRACPTVAPAGTRSTAPGADASSATTSIIEANTTVDSPAASNTWASTLTVRVQSGQTGVSSTTSTASANSSAAHAGPVSSRTSLTVSGWLPAKAKWRGATSPITPSVGQLLQAVDRVDHVQVELEPRVVEVRAPVAEHQIPVFSAVGPEARVVGAEAVVADPMQRGRGHHRHPGLGQRLVERGERRLIELRHRQRPGVRPHRRVARGSTFTHGMLPSFELTLVPGTSVNFLADPVSRRRRRPTPGGD